MNRPWIRATLISLLGHAAITLLIFALLGWPASAAGVGEVLGRVGAACALAGVVVGWQGSKAKRPWSWWGWVWRWCVALAVLWALATYGRSR